MCPIFASLHTGRPRPEQRPQGGEDREGPARADDSGPGGGAHQGRPAAGQRLHLHPAGHQGHRSAAAGHRLQHGGHVHPEPPQDQAQAAARPCLGPLGARHPAPRAQQRQALLLPAAPARLLKLVLYACCANYRHVVRECVR
eukprot:scaffold193310_cov29-Prasinocladus_malaysianus.AAC.1